jgi:hypothetical protein
MISGSIALATSNNITSSLSFINNLVTGATTSGSYFTCVSERYVNQNIINELKNIYGYNVSLRNDNEYVISWGTIVDQTPTLTNTNTPTPTATTTPEPATVTPTSSPLPATAIPTETPTPTPTVVSGGNVIFNDVVKYWWDRGGICDPNNGGYTTSNPLIGYSQSGNTFCNVEYFEEDVYTDFNEFTNAGIDTYQTFSLGYNGYSIEVIRDFSDPTKLIVTGSCVLCSTPIPTVIPTSTPTPTIIGGPTFTPTPTSTPTPTPLPTFNDMIVFGPTPNDVCGGYGIVNVIGESSTGTTTFCNSEYFYVNDYQESQQIQMMGLYEFYVQYNSNVLKVQWDGFQYMTVIESCVNCPTPTPTPTFTPTPTPTIIGGPTFTPTPTSTPTPTPLPTFNDNIFFGPTLNDACNGYDIANVRGESSTGTTTFCNSEYFYVNDYQDSQRMQMMAQMTQMTEPYQFYVQYNSNILKVESDLSFQYMTVIESCVSCSTPTPTPTPTNIPTSTPI